MPFYLNANKLISNIDNHEIDNLTALSRITRALSFAAIEAAQSGHPGGSSSKTEMLLAAVLGGFVAFDALDPKNPGRDRFVWSAGHCTPLLYGFLALVYECLRRSGRQFSEAATHAVFPEHLVRFRKIDGLPGHAESTYPLSDICTGSSGWGLSAAGGLGILHKSCGLNTKVWVMMGDAETEEGITYEARNIISAVGADNVIVLMDQNRLEIDGMVNEIISSCYSNHWLGMGWNVIECHGHDFVELLSACKKAKDGFNNGLPTIILAQTIKGKCYGSGEGDISSHGKVAKHGDYIDIMKGLGFAIPGVSGNAMLDIETVLESLSEELVEFVCKKIEYAAENIPKEGKLMVQMKKALVNRPMIDPRTVQRPNVLPAELIFAPGSRVSTRKASQAWFKWFMEQTAFFYIGSGDLSGSILTDKAEHVYGILNNNNPFGRGIRFGIAEQNMSMIGAALSQDILPGGFKAVSAFGSYGVFTTIMANSVRMALIGNNVNSTNAGFFVVIASHDGPETGEDGPTHQGLYWMSLYKALPGIKVYKPNDANETVEMLFYALEKREPIILSLSRPDTLVFERQSFSHSRDAVYGAYVFKPYSENGNKKIVLAVCGGLVLENVLKVTPKLVVAGFDVKIVAVTSPELFSCLRKDNPNKAKEILVDDEVDLVVTIHNGWSGFLDEFLGSSYDHQRAIGVDNYLRSGTKDELYKFAGLDGDSLLNKILSFK